MKHRRPVLLLLALLLAPAACGSAQPRSVVLASTTSVQDAGLYDVLLPAFEKAYPRYRIDVVAVGSGEALAMGVRGDADVVMVHAPRAESTFVAQGHAVERLPVMEDRFVIVGPPSDPAKIHGMRDAAAALKAIDAAHATFISRADNSGTDKREKQLWRDAGIDPATLPKAGGWYLQAGQGMAAVLRMAAEKSAYTLTDLTTFRVLQKKLSPLTVLMQGDPRLLNPYHIITVRGARDSAGARIFAHWIAGRGGQALISKFGVQRFGAPLFVTSH